MFSKRHLLLLILTVWAGLRTISPARPAYSREEYIVVSGGPALRQWEEYRSAQEQHDRYWGNFIKAARIRIDQLRIQHGAALNLTWIIYRPAYLTRQREDLVKRPPDLCGIPEITSLASLRQTRLVWFDNTPFLIDYLNRRNGRKLSGFEYFGHSNKFAFLFDYSNEILGVSSCYLHCVELSGLHRGLFTSDAEVRSWGCNTGDYMSRVWKRQTGHRMIGASAAGIPGCTGKTDYSAISDGVTLPTVNGRWVD